MAVNGKVLFTKGKHCEEWDDSELIEWWEESNQIFKQAVANKESGGDKHWTAGDPCRAYYSDGQIYEAVIKKVCEGKCVVDYLGYNEQGTVETTSLQDSLGKPAQFKQVRQAELDNADYGDDEYDDYGDEDYAEEEYDDDVEAAGDGVENMSLNTESSGGLDETDTSTHSSKKGNSKSPMMKNRRNSKHSSGQQQRSRSNSHHQPAFLQPPSFLQPPNFPNSQIPPFSSHQPPMPFTPAMPPFMPPSFSHMPTLPPMPPPPVLQDSDVLTDDTEALSSMLMAWYMSGYHSGLYQGLRQAKLKKEKQRRTSNTH